MPARATRNQHGQLVWIGHEPHALSTAVPY